MQLVNEEEVIIACKKGLYIVTIDEELRVTLSKEQYLKGKNVDAIYELNGLVYACVRGDYEIKVIDRSKKAGIASIK